MIPRLFRIPYGCGKMRKDAESISYGCGISGGMRANFRRLCEKVCEISNNTNYCVEKRVEDPVI